MKVIIVTGFLGSGKTTLIMALGTELVKAGKSVAIIENDFGKVGVDSIVLRDAGFTVSEISQGCICCTLGPNFLAGLKDIHLNLRPDVVIVEPSGIANPDTILANLEYYPGPQLEPTHIIALIDGPRFHSMLPAFEKPLRAQLKVANIICISKSDRTSDDQADEIVTWIDANFKNVKVVHLALPAEEGTANVLQEVSA
jgi:G3E family GTPase